jgi:DNA-binding CsgD family transcriptional regulator
MRGSETVQSLRSSRDGSQVDALRIDTAGRVRTVALAGDRLSVGRGGDNDLIFGAEKTVSREHAVLERRGETWQIRDLRSRNGTFVNGIRVTAPTPVQAGDVLTVGAVSMTLAVGLTSEQLAAETLDVSDLDEEGNPRLSERETAVVRLVGAGLTNAQIAKQLNISVHTVTSHLDRIRDKTGARRKADLTRLAMQLGLTT